LVGAFFSGGNELVKFHDFDVEADGHVLDFGGGLDPRVLLFLREGLFFFLL
jgi:hypothetical protein